MKKLDSIIKKLLREATGDSSGGRGSYAPPMQPGLRPWEKSSLGPFSQSLSDFKSPLVQYDSYDHKFDLRRDQIKELEKTASKIQDFIKHHPYSTFSDDDGNPVNPYMQDGFNPNIKEKMEPFTIKVPFNEWVEVNDNLINELTSSRYAGEYNGPIEIGMKKWRENEVEPFAKTVDSKANLKKIKSTTKGNLKRTVGMWEKGTDGTYDIDTHHVDTINEDLAVWFGKKKKPKGSSQPKGPWVNICRKVDGKHPPCGRHDTSKGSYPKCRAAGVAGKMSDSAKKAACAQKRAAEKKDPQTGKGQKPVMTSYKPKKKTNEQLYTNEELKKLIGTVIQENIQIAPQSMKPKKLNSKEGLELTCIKLNLKRPKDSESTDVGPYPWSLVKYDKEARPIQIHVSRPSYIPRDAVYEPEDGENEEMVLQFEEVKQPELKKILTNKKYVLVTYKTPALTGKQYCKVNGDMDPEWDKNLFSYGNNALVIDPYTKLN